MSKCEVYKLIISTENFVIGELVFSESAKGYDFLEKLKESAQPEEWKYKKRNSVINYPILKSYVEHTYDRLKAENKLLESKDKKQILFDVGLLKKDFLWNIYIVCTKISIDIFGEKVVFPLNPQIVFEDDTHTLKNFTDKEPKVTRYFTTIEEVVFNPDYDININWSHIFKRQDRIPDDLKKGDVPLKEIIQKFTGNEKSLKKMARRNYKMVVPQYYDDKIQFLMPIYLGTEFSGMPDFALVLSLDSSGEKPVYIGTTILTVEMAYQNARLIAKPDNPWLLSSLVK